MKRAFDILVSVLLLVVLSPLLAIVAVCVRLFLGSPVLYRQARPGLYCAPFELVKFRTMLDLRDVDGQPLPDEQRMSTFGSFLRKTSIDELPELWNVICGDMSLVGPRPLLLEYVPLYSPEQRRRQDVRPGITGWAQINGRNAISWEERFALDVWYVNNRSFLLDLKILFLTLGALLRPAGISQEGHVTMEKFRGSKQ